MKLTLNKDYAKRHLFVAILMTGLGLWFAFDGFIRYPSLPATELYKSIEKSDPPASCDLDGFKRQKIHTQYGFTVLALGMALIVGLRLGKSARFSFEYDDGGFTANGKRHAYGDIATIDSRRLETKSIATVTLRGGGKIVLDAWHHSGVRDFLKTAAMANSTAP